MIDWVGVMWLLMGLGAVSCLFWLGAAFIDAWALVTDRLKHGPRVKVSCDCGRRILTDGEGLFDYVDLLWHSPPGQVCQPYWDRIEA